MKILYSSKRGEYTIEKVNFVSYVADILEFTESIEDRDVEGLYVITADGTKMIFRHINKSTCNDFIVDLHNNDRLDLKGYTDWKYL